jgi:hypothetical protein
VAALFFLDADNRLAPGALEDAWAALRANPQAGWVYTSIDSFGVEWNGNYGIPYAPLVHIAHNNICDTGSLVRRAVFEAGVRFDEDRRAGYEDWDFFLQALGKGFYGQPASFGFAYRQRPESRYREMNHSRDAQKAYLGVRHRELARASTLLRFEHERDPRYMLHLTGSGQNLRFTDPAQPGTGIDDATLAEPDAYPLPPFFVWGSAEVIATLTRLKLLHNVFWLLERGCGGGAAGHPLFAVAFEHAYNRILTCSNLLAGDLHALGVPEDKIIAIRNAAGFEAPPEARTAALYHKVLQARPDHRGAAAISWAV